MTDTDGKYFIGVDCEGVACAVGRYGAGLDGENLEFARREAALEANAAATALFDAGAREVIVWDNHHIGLNLDYRALDSRCGILLGAGHRGRFAGIDESFAAVLFIGYHAMAGTRGATLCHTYSSSDIQYYKINGVEVGELEIDAAYAGEYGVPVLFCASDDLCVAEAKRFFGGIAAVETKKSLSWNSALSRHPDAVCRDIYETVKKAAEEGPKTAPFTFSSPVRVEIRFQRSDAAASARLYGRDGRPFELTDGFTRAGTLNSIRDLF